VSRSRSIKRPRPSLRKQIAALLVEDPFHEKSLLQKDANRWILALVEKVRKRDGLPAKSALGFTPESLRKRICDVYRLCYERSVETSQTKIVYDFAAFFPDLIFCAKWFIRLLQAPAVEDNGTLKKKLFLALSKGFRRAASTVGSSKQLFTGRVEAAKIFRSSEIVPHLRKWELRLDRKHSNSRDTDWLGARTASEVDALIVKYPALKPCRRHLTDLLLVGKLYEASVLISATVFRVPAHQLERNPLVAPRPVEIAPKN